MLLVSILMITISLTGFASPQKNTYKIDLDLDRSAEANRLYESGFKKLGNNNYVDFDSDEKEKKVFLKMNIDIDDNQYANASGILKNH